MPPASPEHPLDRPLLRQMAGGSGFALGEACFAEGRVRQIAANADRVSARVAGTRAYRVKLWRARGELRFSCTCPAGREAAFCKHCVAVGLAWLAGPDGQAKPDADAGPEADAFSRQNLQAYLRRLDPERLAALVLEASDYDDILRRRLLLETLGLGGKAGRKGAAAPDVAAYRQILHEAIECPDYVDSDAMPDYAQGVEEAIAPFAALLKRHPAAVVDLAEFALIELDRASEMLDGGDGSLNAVYDDLQRHHLEACRAARPDPAALAARLLDFELEGGLGVFGNTCQTYADVLGAAGLRAWRERLLAEWSALPSLTAAPTGRRADPAPIDHRRFQMQALAERLAETEGDLELLAAIKQRDLSGPEDYLSIAEVYRSAGQPEQAQAWAERGLSAFPAAEESAGLREFIAALERPALF